MRQHEGQAGLSRGGSPRRRFGRCAALGQSQGQRHRAPALEAARRLAVDHHAPLRPGARGADELRDGIAGGGHQNSSLWAFGARRVAIAFLVCSFWSYRRWHRWHIALRCESRPQSGSHLHGPPSAFRCATVSTILPFAHFAGCPFFSLHRRGPGCVWCSPHSPMHSHWPSDRVRIRTEIITQSLGYLLRSYGITCPAPRLADPSTPPIPSYDGPLHTRSARCRP